MNLILGRHHLGRWPYLGPVSSGSSEATKSLTPLKDNVFAIKCYGTDGVKVAEYSSSAENNTVKSLKFSLIETGCGNFEIEFLALPHDEHFDYNRRVDIHLFNDSRPWYSGRVLKRPTRGTTARTFKISGFGHYSLLDRVNVFDTYEDKDVADIVRDIGTQIEAKVGIRAISSEIVKTGYRVTKIGFDGEKAKEAIKQLTEFAANYISGVDEYNRIYFKKISSDINEHARFWVGEHVELYEPEEDFGEIVNYARVKGGKLNDDGTNWLAVVEDLESQANYGRREAVWTLPSAFDESDATRWAIEELGIKKEPKHSAILKGVTLEYPNADGSFNVRKLSTRGRAAIFSREAPPRYYPISQINYTVTADKGIQCEMKLGELKKDVGSWLASIEREAKNQEFLSSNNTKQLKGG